MSLTWKLILGFLFALVLQVAQMLTSSYFTARVVDASMQISNGLTASLAVQSGLDAARTLRDRLQSDQAGDTRFDPAWCQVFVDEVVTHGERIESTLVGDDALPPRFSVALGAARHQLADLSGRVGSGEEPRDELGFFDDAMLEVVEALLQAQVRVRQLAAAEIQRERAVRNLPLQASIAITLAGVVLMGAFVVWYSRQMVVPIQRAWSELEQRVLDRTAELAAARDAADTANRAKTAFLANVSHELRTPMTAILGYSELLLDPAAAGRAEIGAEATETIRRNAEHMVTIVSDLLDMAKLEAGKLSVELGPCEPLRLVEEVIALLRPKALGKRVTLTAVLRTPVPERIHSDALRLRQILVNLVDNAIKFSPDGQVAVELALRDGDAPQLCFAVVDTGVGLAPEAMARLFQPFEQADVSTTRRFGGTGLGLAISRQLAQLLGGGIEVQSEEGRGSRFEVAVATGPLHGVVRRTAFAVAIAATTNAATVSAATASAPPASEATAPAANGADAMAAANAAASRTPSPTVGPVPAGSVPLAGLRVLLVEDGPDNQRLIRHVLERAGCMVEIAANGQLCLDRMALPEAAFDVLLMDLQMPVMDGITATQVLRQLGFTVPILALTANAMPADRELCRVAGCDDFLTKPIDRKRLVATIAAQVGAHRAAGAGGGAALGPA